MLGRVEPLPERLISQVAYLSVLGVRRTATSVDLEVRTDVGHELLKPAERI